MRKSVKRNFCLFVCLIIVSSFFLLPSTALSQGENKDKVIAVVGKEKITEGDILLKKAMLPAQIRGRYETEEGRNDLIEQAIKSSLLSQEARSLGIPEKPEVAKRIKEITDAITIQALLKEEISKKISISDDEIAAFYKDNQNMFVKPERVNVSLIFFKINDKNNADEKAQVQKKAESVLNKIKEGARIEVLAKESSEDEISKKRGGYSGFFSLGERRNRYGDVFEEKSFSLKKGEVSEVFEDKGGLYIIKVLDKKEKQTQKLDEVRKRIESRINQQKQKEAFEKYLESLKKKYSVTITK